MFVYTRLSSMKNLHCVKYFHRRGIVELKIDKFNQDFGLQKRNICGTLSNRHGDRTFFESSKKGEYEGRDLILDQNIWMLGQNRTYRNEEGDNPRIIRLANQTAPERKITLDHLKMGFLEIKTEVKKWREEIAEKIEGDHIFVRPGDTDTVFNFKTQEDLDNWIVTSDSDYKEGFSKASLVLSPTGHGLFAGELDTRIPKDGKVKMAGYSNITSKYLRKSFKREIHYNWSLYTHLVMRVRGDGRRYMLLLNTSGEFDMSWNDRFMYILYTRGGPYWQNVKIPFSKFLLTSRGRIQDKQFRIPLARIKTFGITCSDRICSSFRLEIDSIGVHYDNTHTEEFAYEMYRVPPFISSGNS